MDWLHILHAILSLVFVIGLLFLCLWIFKYLESKGLHNKIFAQVNSKQKIKNIETKRIDSKNAITIVDCQNIQYTLLLSQSGNLILNKEKKAANND